MHSIAFVFKMIYFVTTGIWFQKKKQWMESSGNIENFFQKIFLLW